MHSLYWRIFLAFWLALALILVGTVTVAVNATAHRTERPWVQRGQLYAQAARAFETGGPEALRNWLQALPGEPFSRTFVVDPSGKELLGRPLPPYLSGAPGSDASRRAANVGPIAPVGGALVLVGADGATWHVVVGPVRETPRLFGELELPGVPLAIVAIALIVSAALCFVLARQLAAPVDRLRLATRLMAEGDLNVRILPALKERQDDLGLLAADLDTMAQRLRHQLESKQQLLRDVSHELRSPLTRLQLALSLAEREKGDVDRHLTRIALEADRLEQLIARTLQLVRLERPAATLESVPLDLGELLRTIAADVAIEADAQGCLVNVHSDSGLALRGDPELLRSAFENVIRNAVRYSPSGALISINARRMSGDAGERDAAEIIVRDHGPGVPDKDLQLIFEPFYRVEAARDHRTGGGEGLGLAIAARAVSLHGGAIEARNAQGGGLAVSISLPLEVRRPAASEVVTA
ncbi:MAG TPA: ATP-binding protein [Steroidobacteraceae bacterium]|nr:ATP-binding protein [Steroidobacteraceae bacterium]